MSAATEQAGHGHGAHGGAEPDNPKLVIIGPAVIFTIVLFVSICVGVVEFYQFAYRDQVADVELRPPNSMLKELRAKETAHLSEYRYVDKQKGVVRIPKERAVELTLRDWDRRPGGVKEIAPTPAPAAPAPAPGAPK